MDETSTWVRDINLDMDMVPEDDGGAGEGFKATW
jgi:hypothetical protein